MVTKRNCMQKCVILLSRDGGRAIWVKSRKQLKLGQLNKYSVYNCCVSRQWASKCNRMQKYEILWNQDGGRPIMEKSRKRPKVGQNSAKLKDIDLKISARKCASKHNGKSSAKIKCQNVKCQTYSDQTPHERRLFWFKCTIGIRFVSITVSKKFTAVSKYQWLSDLVLKVIQSKI